MGDHTDGQLGLVVTAVNRLEDKVEQIRVDISALSTSVAMMTKMIDNHERYIRHLERGGNGWTLPTNSKSAIISIITGLATVAAGVAYLILR